MNAPVELAASLHPREQRRNYIAHSIEGGLYIGGLAFVHPQTVLPRMVEKLGGPPWMIASAPVMLAIGFTLPGIFVSHRIERLHRMKPFVMTMGVLQRLPYLIAGLTLLYFTHAVPALVLSVLLLTPLMSGLMAGICVTAWKEMLVRTIPTQRRASVHATRFLVGALLGLAAGKAVKILLTHYDPSQAYAVLHLLVFGFVALSFGVFSLIREPVPSEPPRARAQSFTDYVSNFSVTLRSESELRRYLWARVLTSGMHIAIPFYSIQALERLHQPDGFLGVLLGATMAGTLVGNVLGGFVGDRFGARILLVVGYASMVVVTFGTLLAGTTVAFIALSALFGASLTAIQIGVPTLDLEICPPEKRIAYQGFISLAMLVGLLGAASSSALLKTFTVGYLWLSIASGASVLLGLWLLLGVREPRVRHVLRR